MSRPAEEAAVRVERVSPTAPDVPPPPDEVNPGDEPYPDASRPDAPFEPHERPSPDELIPPGDEPPEEG
ncbi:MAG TPA: hypothetical protein VFZ85_14250 [Jiangellaceae bacterium]